MENFTIEFREEQNLGHWSNLGTNGIDLSGVSDCWIRNICIKNANNGITLYASNISILDIVFDNFAGRVGDESEGYAGHQGIKINTAYNLIHNVIFKADDYEHTISFNNGGRYNVISRVSSHDMQLDDHGGSTGFNLFTEIDLGEGTPEVGRQTYRGSHDYSTFWNINAVRDQPYKEIFNENKDYYQGADIKYINTVVGLKTSLPTVTAEEYWHEKIDPALLQPQNIYIAQLIKNGKDLPASFDASKNPGKFIITASAGSNGSIAPDGSVTVSNGSEQTFDISADIGYEIEDVMVDGVSVGAVSSYTFSGIEADHNITVRFVQITTGTSSFFIGRGAQMSSSFIIFPNPTNGNLHISGIVGKARVRIFDLLGKEWVNTEAGSNNALDVSELSAGMYIIEVRENDKRVLQRLFKQ